ncbi:MAG TPA: CoA-binding protein [Anaerolineaceae bacterium]|nr:CoA-binding protein [Anaerolineaceae bacterium]
MLEIDFNDSDEDLRDILENSRVVAMVGESDDHYYSSYQVAQYLKEMGYKVYPVNPMIESVEGDRSYPSLTEVPEPIDVVDVFRDPMYLSEIVDEAITVGAKTLWAQLDVVSSDQEPERRAKMAGLKVVSNHCMRIEHERLKIPAKPMRQVR